MFFTDYSNERTKRGELMDKETPLIDYAHSRCDDDVTMAHKLATALKCVGIITACVAMWFIILDLAFTAIGA